jgi:ubiquinone biosynthesis monooxygenase Coq7
MTRSYTPIDRFIIGVDNALRMAAGRTDEAQRKNPAESVPEVVMEEDNRKHAAGLMRINHAGEVCAQALYAGQAVTARNPALQADLKQAANEEIDHLSWCKDRLDDGWSLGFLKETENQVEAHLEGHIEKLPPEDARSRAILDQMKIDEAKHAKMAEDSGAYDLPRPVKRLMKVTAAAMKAVAYRV